ncbi:MAG TPA: FHA domain-containing protein [Polyangiaceae bacterium]|jgi:pSer/pThr/pTyr-binding forkhead associated (FHA) protein|nr:FHA domain-containing protein [Polyangiaceae bacterium]
MWKLTIEDDEGQRTSLDLALDEYTIGRAEDRAIRLTERNISRKHAILRLTVDGWELEDEGAYNGSYVNGQRVGEEPAIMQSGDVIQLGDYRIEMLDAAEVQPRPEEPRQRRPDRLVMVIGPMPGIEFSLDGDRLSIGRAEEAHISINHASVSRLHAELINLGQSRWEVIDQGSSNGLRINGVELRRGIIEPGDALELGDVRLRFVAAGKFFRPMVDISAQLPTVGGFEGMAPGAARVQSTRNFGAIFAVALLAVALVVAGLVIVGGRTTNSSAGSNGDVVRPLATTEEDQKDALARAQELAQEDIFQAHSELLRIPEDSPLRETEEFRALEDRWAEAMFDKAENTEDPEEKRRLYIDVSETQTVSGEKRKKAVLEADKIVIPKEGSAPRPGPFPPGPRTPTTPYDQSSKPEPVASAPSPAPDDRFNTDAQKKGLLGKLYSGRATMDELRMLKAICMGDGDRACRDAAVAEIKRKQTQSP